MRESKIVGIVVIVTAILLLVNEGSTQIVRNADEMKVWNKMIIAKGGREALHAVNNLVVTTRGRNTNDEKMFQDLFIEDLYVLPDRWWSWTDQRPGFPLNAEHYDFAKEIGYSVSELSNKVATWEPNKSRAAGVPVSVLELDGSGLNNNKKERFIHDQLIYLMETQWLKPVVLGSRKERGGFKSVDVVEASFGRKRYQYYLDPKTDLPAKVKITTCFVGLPTCNEDELYLSDYIEIAGVKFPQKVSRGKGDETRKTYQVNVRYDAKLFDRPPSIAAGPDAWKPKK